MNYKTKVIYIQGTLTKYNDPIYEMVNEKVDLTLAYVEKTEVKAPKYKSFQFPSCKIGPFIYHKHLKKVINEYDVVIFSPHLRFLRTALLPFSQRKPRLITWDIGLHVSYNKKYDLSKAPDLKDKVFQFIQNHCDACIFYMPQPVEYWKKFGNIETNKYFVAHNTVKVAEFDSLPPFETRDKFLFVGTLYRQKGLGELIEAYAVAKKQVENLPLLYIVGKGPEELLIRNLIKSSGLEDSIVMTGAIYDESILKNLFLSSLLCISPKQAGLSVQKSLGYGTPFVTRPDAITGGERFDVIDGKNGFFYESIEGLSEILVRSIQNPSELEEMSNYARAYYLEYASPEGMAQAALDAIEFVMNKAK